MHALNVMLINGYIIKTQKVIFQEKLLGLKEKLTVTRRDFR